MQPVISSHISVSNISAASLSRLSPSKLDVSPFCAASFEIIPVIIARASLYHWFSGDEGLSLSSGREPGRPQDQLVQPTLLQLELFGL